MRPTSASCDWAARLITYQRPKILHLNRNGIVFTVHGLSQTAFDARPIMLNDVVQVADHSEIHMPVQIVGPTGVGKTYLACALLQKACRLGKSALYVRLPRLLEELKIARADGSHKRRLTQLAKIDVLALDDWGLTALESGAREDLLEIIDDRSERRPTLITAQLPIEHWHPWIGEPTIADAILDRLLHHAHRLTLQGESLRRRKTPKNASETHTIVNA